MRTGVYTRLSRKDRHGTAASCERQERLCRQHATSEGWQVLESYRDADRSGFKHGIRRDDYERLLADVREGLLDVLLVWRFDRLTRDPITLEPLIAACVERQVRPVSVMELVDWRNPRKAWNEVRRRVLDAEDESIVKSERVGAAHAELAEQGGLSGGGKRPFGFAGTLRDDRGNLIRPAGMELDLVEAAAVREGRDIIFSGGSLGDVVRAFDSQGITTVTGKRWTTTTANRMLCSGRICGLREYHGVIVGPAVWPAIISPEDGEKLRTILRDPDRSRYGGVAPRSYLLSGFLQCGRPECQQAGSLMTARPHQMRRGDKVYRYRRYVCSADRGGCDRNGISASRLDDLIEEMILQHLEDPKILASLHAAQDDGELARLRAAIIEAEQRQAQITHDHYRVNPPLLERSEFLREKRAVDDELKRLRKARDQRRAQSTLASLPDDVSQVRADWKVRGLDGKRALVAALLERISIAPTSRSNNRFDKSRVDPLWRHRPTAR